MNKLRTGDRVVVLTGRDRGRQGTIEKLLGDQRAIVKDVNIVKKHQKPNPMKSISGGIVPMEAPIHISNIALVHPETGQGDRVGIRFNDAGKKERFFKSDGASVDV